MGNIMKKKNQIKKGIVIAFIGYILLTLIRFTYLELVPQDANNSLMSINSHMSDSVGEAVSNSIGISKIKQNYASDKRTINTSEAAKQVTIDQKYERIGFVSSKTDNFDSDRTKILNVVTQNKGVIQYENNSGIVGARTFGLSIGVLPEKFDSFVENIKSFGEVFDFRVEKTDKTSEYKDLMAKKATFEKMRESLRLLKDKGGSITDLINLENKILEIEEKVQSFGVELGNFNEENELCTVKISLIERKYLKVENSLSYKVIIKNFVQSLFWTLGYYALLIFMLILAGILTYVLLLIINKFKETFISHFDGNNDQT